MRLLIALIAGSAAVVAFGCGTDSTVVGGDARAGADAIDGFDAHDDDDAAAGDARGGADLDAEADRDGATTDGGSAADGGSTGVERDVCSGRDDGFHCGIADDGAHGAVFVCAGGRLDDTQVCDAGCWSDGPASASCLPVDPGTCVDLGDGAWCAGALAIPGVPADALVRCARGATLAVETCADGCEPGPAGAHACAGTEPNPCAGRVDGLWCSDELPVDEAGLLVTCRSGLAIGVADCDAGCVGNGAGGALCADVGADPCDGAPDGLHCGSAIGGMVGDALLTCTGGLTTAGELCVDGCFERDGDDTCDGDAVDPCHDESDGARPRRRRRATRGAGRCRRACPTSATPRVGAVSTAHRAAGRGASTRAAAAAATTASTSARRRARRSRRGSPARWWAFEKVSRTARTTPLSARARATASTTSTT